MAGSDEGAEGAHSTDAPASRDPVRALGDGGFLDVESIAAGVSEVKMWYHTMELAPGVVTPGWFDLRPTVGKIPWPEVRGLRCLDVATSDGFLAFELERRGAAEVLAVDIASHEDWDWLPRDRDRGPAVLGDLSGEKGRGFEVAAAAIGSKVKKHVSSVYDLCPATLGKFDVVVCGWLMLHLRDPFRALEAIRGVCAGWFLSIEQIDPRLSIVDRRRGAFSLRGEVGQWIVPSRRGVIRMLEVAGFDVVSSSKPYATAFGPAHPPVRHSRGRFLGDLMCKGRGVPTVAVLARVPGSPGSASYATSGGGRSAGDPIGAPIGGSER